MEAGVGAQGIEVGIFRRSLFKREVDYRQQCQDAMDLSLKAERGAVAVLR